MSNHTYGYACILKKITVFVLQVGREHQEINCFEKIFYYNVGKKKTAATNKEIRWSCGPDLYPWFIPSMNCDPKPLRRLGSQFTIL
jgi:hypothetical protein